MGYPVCAALSIPSSSAAGSPPTTWPASSNPGWRGTHARTPTPGEGAGLGLAIVQGVTLAQGGTVTVSNAADGCRFQIRLPTRV